ncbi:hypothetical protein AJ80_09062 [Polytolypa hystricis UAMH7299]|uniref:Uncharacterized protein n=1 Tax=Polytolypa hystricis (strain UAMH7299) TaxID=1447883 RepID=A0A2B7WWV9_POLH7|nr:hypothetical protein AJ80_09062 [Polytolypa hystricis UAMH7299]
MTNHMCGTDGKIPVSLYNLLNSNRLQGETKPDPSSWTLRFKNFNVTVLLLVSPVQPFSEIKETLLKALKVRNIAEIDGEPVPDDPSEIEFGVPVDRNNLEKGWKKLELATHTGRKGAGGRRAVQISTPQGADLRDSQAVAFRFHKATPGEEDELDIDLDDPGWNVLIPTYEDEEEDE